METVLRVTVEDLIYDLYGASLILVGQIQNQDINQIILILTDQTAVFSPEERRSQHYH